MSMTDPIADMLTRIRNAQMVEQTVVVMPSSKVKLAIAKVLKDEGYIEGFKVSDAGREAAARDRAPLLRRAPGDREDRAGVEAGAAHLQGQGRHSARDERSRHRDRLDVARRDDRPQGARYRRRRRSSLHRRLTESRTKDVSHWQSPHSAAGQGRSDAGRRRDHGQGTARHADAHLRQQRVDREGRRHARLQGRQRRGARRCTARCARWSRTWSRASPRASRRS